MLFAALVVCSGKISLALAVLLVTPFWWALLYGICSGSLLVWRLITNNPSDKPLWNRLATMSACVGLFFGALAVFLTVYSPAKASAEALPPADLALMFVFTVLLVMCLAYGIGAGIRHVRGRR